MLCPKKLLKIRNELGYTTHGIGGWQKGTKMAVKELYVIPNGFVKEQVGAVMTDQPLPIALYLIRTDDGNVLFDTGMNPLVISDPQKAWGRNLLKFIQPIMTEDDHPIRLLNQIGLSPKDIDFVVLSHLHFDHAGGNSIFPKFQDCCPE